MVGEGLGERRGGGDRIPCRDRRPAIDAAECGGVVAGDENPVADLVGALQTQADRAFVLGQGPFAAEIERAQIGPDQGVLAAELLADQLFDRRHVHVQERRQGAQIDDVLEQLALAGVVVFAVGDRGQRRADDGDVVAKLRRRHRLGRVIKQIAAGLDLGEVLVPGLRVHRHHHVDPAAAAEMALFADPHLEPGRQALDVRRKDVARARRDPHAQDRLGEQRVGAGRARSVDIGEFDDEVVDALQRGCFEVCL